MRSFYPVLSHFQAFGPFGQVTVYIHIIHNVHPDLDSTGLSGYKLRWARTRDVQYHEPCIYKEERPCIVRYTRIGEITNSKQTSQKLRQTKYKRFTLLFFVVGIVMGRWFHDKL